MYNESVWLNLPRSRVRIEQRNFAHKGQISILHYHDEMELLLIRSGSISCTVDGREYTAGEGECLFINTRIPHYTAANTETATYLILQFRPSSYQEEDLLSDLQILRMSRYKPAALLRSPEIADALLRMFDESEKQEKAYDFMIRSDVYRIIALLTRLDVLPPPEQGIDSKEIARIRPALDYIDAKYASPITLREISEHLFLNPAYFCRLFRAVTGFTFTEYLSYVRVRKSEILLCTTEMSITEVSFQVGFSSVTYFNRVFRKIMNCTPTTFRKLRGGNP